MRGPVEWMPAPFFQTGLRLGSLWSDAPLTGGTHNVNKLSNHLDSDNLITPQDVATAAEVSTNTGGYVSMANYRKGLVVVTAHLSDTKTAAAQLTCSTAATEAGKLDVTSKTVTLTGTTAAPEQVGVIDFDVSDLYAMGSTNYFVGVDVTTNENGNDVAAVLIRGAGRHVGGTMDS